MKRALYLAIATLGILAISVIPASGAHISEGVNKVTVSVTNPSNGTLSHGQVPFVLSSKTLIDGDYVDDDVFNTDVLDGSSHVGYMPGVASAQMLACFDNTASDETTDCNDAGVDDITLPAANGEVFEFAADNQWNALHITISTPAVADWTVVWEYWNGAAYVALDNVQDGTSEFTEDNVRKVSWDFPAAGAWPKSTLHSVAGYWVQARVSAASSVTTPPLGAMALYEVGRWWTLADSLEPGEQKQFDVQLDTTPGSVTVSFSSTATSFGPVGTDTVYPPAYDSIDYTSANTCLPRRDMSGSDYIIRPCIMSWDTSSLPEPIEVTAAGVTCTVGAINDTNSRSVVWEWFANSGAGAQRHYHTIAQSNAHTGTTLASMSGTVTFDLTNLYRINRQGPTGLRGHISGTTPTGGNNVSLTNCELSVTYSTEKQQHSFFPNTSGGYTLADAAALEPGSDFSIVIAGYIDTTAGASKLLWGKTASRVGIVTHPTSDNIIRLEANGGSHVQTGSVVTPGYHVIEIQNSGSGNGDRSVILIDGTDITSSSGAAIADVSTAWAMGVNNAIPYMDYVVYEISQVDTVVHELRDTPEYQLDDWTGNGHDATMHFPNTSSTYTVSLGSVTPNESTTGAGTGSGIDVLGGVPEITNLSDADTSSSGGFFLFDIMSDVASTSGFPYQALVTFFALGVTIAAAVVVAMVFKEALPVGISVVILLVIFWQMGAIPGWMPVLFSIGPLVFFLVWKKANP